MLGERLKELRKKNGLSLEDVADRVGTSRQTIHRYETGVISNIPHDRIESLAAALSTTPADLMGWEGWDPLATFNNIKKMNVKRVKSRRLPILGNVACGEPIFASESYEDYICEGSEPIADFCLVAKGDSMINARIFDGDILFVRRQESVSDGEIAVVLIEDEATVKRVYFNREDGILTLMPENPTYKPMRFTGTSLDSIRILGKVVSGRYRV